MSIISDAVEMMLSTPSIANEIKNVLVNRDLVLEIDGKKYQITKRKTDDSELDKLKSQMWDLRESLRKIVVAYNENPGSPTVVTLIKSAQALLKNL